eukprot:TRINITY_DN67119_c0_g1_i1.p1 TRINITY_DN67119_c0_g1~~TRINITY_DN67119_c0_g1_i1.p1  ORF type:complete len:420 (+),score=140.69 TRINITY_DN67119_c0_g1_i1:170-1261(+)
MLEACAWNLELAIENHFTAQQPIGAAAPAPPQGPRAADSDGDGGSDAKRQRPDGEVASRPAPDGAAAPAGEAGAAAAAQAGDDGGERVNPTPGSAPVAPPADGRVAESLGMDLQMAVLLTTEQQNKLSAEQEAFPRVGDREELTSLIDEYAGCGDPIFIAKTKELPQRYAGFRRTRRDGNCFARAFTYGFLETCIARGQAGRQEAARVLGVVEAMMKPLKERFGELIDDFVAVLCGQLRDVRDGRVDAGELLDRFRMMDVSDYAGYCCRWIASHHIQENHLLFEPFVGDCKEYCSKQLEAVGTEFEQASIIAVATALGVGVRIEYLDRSPGESCNHHDFPEDVQPSVFLLYRPGHYDLLYPPQ